MQNKQAIIGIAVAVIILLGAGGFFLYSKNGPQPTQTPTAVKEENNDSMVSGNILDILKSGQTQQCNFTSKDENIITSGVVYLSNREFRADFDITKGTDKSAISMIRKGDDNYIWGTEFPNNNGVKMTLSIDEFAESDQTKDYLNPDQNVDYSCKAWVADSSVFNPPSNIKFTDLSGLMPTSIKSTTGTSSAN